MCVQFGTYDELSQAHSPHASKKSPDDFEEGDIRRIIPRYSKENFPNVLKVVEEIQAIGEKHGASAGQATLAWLLAQGQDVIPIPGTRNVKVKRETFPSAAEKV